MSELNVLGKSSQCSNQVSDKVRLITYSEYYNMSPKYASTSSSYPNVENITKISTTSDFESWLYNSKIGDYWSMQSLSANGDYKAVSAYYIYSVGNFGWNDSDRMYHVRPVITIVK